MSNDDRLLRGIRGERKGKKGRIFKFPLTLEIMASEFKGATAVVEIFVPDRPNYKPIKSHGPYYFNGQRLSNGHWIPQRLICRKEMHFYPPPAEGQVIPLEYQERALAAKDDVEARIHWPKGEPGVEDLENELKLPLPKTGRSPKPQRPLERRPNYTPTFRRFDNRIPEKEMVNGRWGYRMNIDFPQFPMHYYGQEVIATPAPIENLFIPWTPEYRFYNVQPQVTMGRTEEGKIVEIPIQLNYRYWPPSYPGQHIPTEWKGRVLEANKGKQVDMTSEDANDPLPTYTDPNIPVKEMKFTGQFLKPGYTYNNIHYPPFSVEAPRKLTVHGKERKVQGHEMTASFPNIAVSKFVPTTKYYEPVKLSRPKTFNAVLNFEKIPGEIDNEECKFETPEHFEFWFFPAPKKEQSLEKLSDEQKRLADPKSGNRVYVLDTIEKEFRSVPETNIPLTKGEARRRKGRKGVHGGQPTAFMKYAVLNRAQRKANQPGEELPLQIPPNPSKKKSSSKEKSSASKPSAAAGSSKSDLQKPDSISTKQVVQVPLRKEVQRVQANDPGHSHPHHHRKGAESPRALSHCIIDDNEEAGSGPGSDSEDDEPERKKMRKK